MKTFTACLFFAVFTGVNAIEFSIGPVTPTPSNGKAIECKQTGGWTVGSFTGNSVSFGGDKKCKEVEQPQSLEEGLDMFKDKLGSVFNFGE